MESRETRQGERNVGGKQMRTWVAETSSIV